MDNLRSDVGCGRRVNTWCAKSLPPRQTGKCAPPPKRATGAPARRPEKRGETRGSRPEPTWNIASGSRPAMGRPSERAPRECNPRSNARPNRRHGNPAERGNGRPTACTGRPKTGEALGASGFMIDWPFAHTNPAESAALRLAQDGPQERGNHPRGSPCGRSRSRSPHRRRGGWWDGPRSKGPGPYPNGPPAREPNRRDTQTWTTVDGVKRCQ